MDQDSTATQDQTNNTVSLLLRVHEKGKNSIGLNGGVSGLSGSFLGLNYQTNNFLGLGETLSLQANLGNLQRNLSFGFTEPYFRNKPISLGFQIFSSKYDYNAAKNYQISTGGGNLSAAQQSLVQNYNQSSTGLTVSSNYLFRHSFHRVGLTYSFQKSSITAFSPASTSLFQTLAFRSGIQSNNALEGIYSSTASLSYTYNKIGNPYNPHDGVSYTALLQMAGLGGNVKYFNPDLRIPPLQRHAFVQAQQGRPQRSRLPLPGAIHPGPWRQGCAALPALLSGRRGRTSRLRHPLRHAVRLHSAAHAIHPHQSGWHAGPARSHQPDAGQHHHPYPHLRHRLRWRRYLVHQQHRIPYPARRTGHVQAV